MIFTVPGRSEGYRALGRFPNWGVMKKYHAFCEKVRLCAVEAGLTLPLVATAERPLWIGVLAYSEDGNVTDAQNISKGVIDALFYTKAKSGTKGDAFVAAWNMPPCWDERNPRTVVFVADDGAESSGHFYSTLDAWKNADRCPPIRTKVRRAARVVPTEQRKPANVLVTFGCKHSRSVSPVELKESGKSLAEFLAYAESFDCGKC